LPPSSPRQLPLWRLPPSRHAIGRGWRHRPTFHHRSLLDYGDVLQRSDDAIDLATGDLRVGGLAPTEPHQ